MTFFVIRAHRVAWRDGKNMKKSDAIVALKLPTSYVLCAYCIAAVVAGQGAVMAPVAERTTASSNEQK